MLGWRDLKQKETCDYGTVGIYTCADGDDVYIRAAFFTYNMIVHRSFSFAFVALLISKPSVAVLWPSLFRSLSLSSRC